MTQPTGRTALYRFFDREDRLVYVGISNNPRARWEGHAADKPWWSSVVTREIEWFDTRKEAESAERREISARSPKWNVAPGMPDRSQPVMRRALRKGWTPPDSLIELFARYECEQEAVGKLRDELERAIVTEMHAGVSGVRMAKFFPWEPETFRRLAKKAGVPPLREATVVSRAKATAPKGSRPAAAAPRQQVTQAVPALPDLTGISPEVAALPYERIRELAGTAEARLPEWVEEIRKEYSDADEHRLRYLIVNVGHRQGRTPPELAASPRPRLRADNPLAAEEVTKFAGHARVSASETQAAKLDQEAEKAAAGKKSLAVMHAALDMELLTYDEVYGELPAATEEPTP